MRISNAWRHELKYRISYAQYLAIRSRLRPVMKPDPHAGDDGKYLIRSIYFDNYEDKALREKIYGVQKREKFRIRWYNDDLSLIHLEKKMKLNELCLKLSSPLTEAEARALCLGASGNGDGLVRELEIKTRLQQLRPRVVVSYTREPYIYAPGNVRVTFDSDIRTSLFRRDFFSAAPHDASATEKQGDIVMEVKFDDFLPDIIAMLLQTEGIRREAFSKYGASRRYG